MIWAQNIILSEELEKAEAMAQEIEVKVKLLEETVEAREAEVELKEKKQMQKEEECEEDNRLLESVAKRKVGLDVVQK